MRVRRGYTVIELLTVLAIISVVTATMMPAVGRSLAQVRLQRAAGMVASNLQLAHSLASRQRQPVELWVDSAQKVVRVRDLANPTRVYAEQRFDRTAENAVGRMEVDNTSVVLYPNGLVLPSITFTLTTADAKRVVTMSRLGQIRIEQ